MSTYHVTLKEAHAWVSVNDVLGNRYVVRYYPDRHAPKSVVCWGVWDKQGMCWVFIQ